MKKIKIRAGPKVAIDHFDAVAAGVDDLQRVTFPLETIRKLKEQVNGDLYVSGSGTLVRAMLSDGLVDGLHLFVFPLTRGSGPRLFPEGAAPIKLSLADCQAYENGVVYLSYRP